MPVYFVTADQIRDRTVTISGPLHHHLRTSLRCQPGDELWVGDDRRHRYRITLTRVGGRELVGDILEERQAPAGRGPSLVVGQALLKGERMDWVIQKAVELGASRIVPLVTGQTVVRPRQERIDSQQARWQRIALEAAQQSEQWDIPPVEAPTPCRRFFATQTSTAARFVLVEPGLPSLSAEGLSSIALPTERPATIVLAIGPEGGWRADELQEAVEAGFRGVMLGPRVLRAETATITALAVLQSRLGELG